MAQAIPPGRSSSPPLSNIAGRAGRNKSPTPPAQPLSKRDKKRQILTEKLAEITASFSANRKQQYQEQLRALEIDMNLILRANPYAERPLEDDPEDMADMISVMTGEGTGAENSNRSINGLAGKYYSQFVDEVNAAMEDRDRDLTMTYNYYHNGLDELHKTNEYKVEMAHQEHAILCSTLRDRLISSVGHKRARLLREKEQLDIADSNALLLNPNQFSIINPSSPGGTHGNRKTRNTRHRPGDPEDVGGGAGVEGNGKRKRKILHDDTDNGSPAPLFRDPENGTATPLRDAKSRLVHSQYEAPLYSIDRLFTEKELSMTANRAHMAALESLAKKRAEEQNAKAPTSHGAGANGSNPRSGDQDAAEDGDGTAATSGAQSQHNNDIEPDSDAPGNSGASPEPGQPTQVVHATRSSGRNIGLSDLATVAATIPPYAVNISAAISKTNPAAIPPAPLKDGEIRDDLERMSRRPDDPRNEDLLEQACVKRVPIGTSLLQSFAHPEWAAHEGGLPGFDADGGSLRAQAMAMARTTSGLGVGGVPMSKQSSMGGMSELGGVGPRRSVSAADYGRGKGRG